MLRRIHYKQKIARLWVILNIINSLTVSQLCTLTILVKFLLILLTLILLGQIFKFFVPAKYILR